LKAVRGWRRTVSAEAVIVCGGEDAGRGGDGAGDAGVDARERLVAFVAEMAAGLAHVRQRENALVYVRGLIEHGGRKSLR
jgi:hypothetical protein